MAVVSPSTWLNRYWNRSDKLAEAIPLKNPAQTNVAIPNQSVIESGKRYAKTTALPAAPTATPAQKKLATRRPRPSIKTPQKLDRI
jgi:hypothetical protein